MTTTQQAGRALVFLPDMSTFSGQASHYRSVRQRLGVADPSAPVVVRRPAPPAKKVRRKPVKITPSSIFVAPEKGASLTLHGVPGWRFLVDLVSARTGVPVDVIIGRSRAKGAVAARHEAIYMIALHTMLSLPEIAKHIELSCHSSVHYALQKYPTIEARRGIGTKPPLDNPLAWLVGLPTHATMRDIVRAGYARRLPVRVIAKAAGTTPDTVRATAYRLGVSRSNARGRRKISRAEAA